MFTLDLSLFAFSALALAFQRCTRKRCLQVEGLTMRSATWNQSFIKILLVELNRWPLWRPDAWIQICASLNHRKVMKPELSQWAFGCRRHGERIPAIPAFLKCWKYMCWSQRKACLPHEV